MKPSLHCIHGLHHADVPHDFFVAEAPLFSRLSTSQPLSDIREDSPLCFPLTTSSYTNPPDTPQEPMEFLSRSWSISALEVAKAFNPIDGRKKLQDCEHKQCAEQRSLTSAPFSFASAPTAQIVMEKIMSHSDASPFTSRRNSYSSGSLNFTGGGPALGSPPLSPRHAEDLNAWLLLQQGIHPEMSSTECFHNNKHFCRSFSGVRGPLRGMSMRRWLKDMKEKRKEALRMHNSRVHAAVSVAGVASAIAAIAASTAACSGEEGQNKTSMAVASAAALVAAQCVEIAENMGADHEQMSAVVSSAVSVKTPGDVMTLTAAAATALRGAATLKARTLKNHHSHATVIPYERGNSNLMSFSGEFTSEDSESEFCNQDFLRRGCEFLKRTRKGELHWRLVYVYLNKNSQVVVKSESKYMGGTITKSKKRYVQDVLRHIPAWPGRDGLDGAEQRWYFGIRTDHGMMELECKNETDYRLWTEGISRLLSRVKHHRLSQECTHS